MTNREDFLTKHKLPTNTSLSLTEISKLSGMPRKALDKVYNRGLAAHRTNPQSVRLAPGSGYGRAFQKGVNAPMSAKLSAPQWGMGRVFAFVQKTDKVFYDADRDIAEAFRLL